MKARTSKANIICVLVTVQIWAITSVDATPFELYKEVG